MRPSLEPTFFDEPPPSPRRALPWRRLLAPVRRLTRLMLTDLRGWSPPPPDDSSRCSRVARALLHRAAIALLLCLALSAGLVHRATRGDPAPPPALPRQYALAFETISLSAADGTRIDAALLPVLDAQRVLRDGVDALRRLHPAAVLVGDPDAAPDQTHPWVGPLHDAGFIVLIVNLRSAERAFGLRESMDVAAAVDALRHRAFVDPDRIAVIACGVGATAARLAALDGAPVAAMILARPLSGPADALDRIVPPRGPVAVLRPLCRWIFQIGHRLDLDDLDPRRFDNAAPAGAVLLTDGGPDPAAPPPSWRVRQGIAFLRHHLPGDAHPLADAR